MYDFVFCFIFYEIINALGSYTIWNEVITKNEVRLISRNVEWGWYGEFNWQFAFKAELDLGLGNLRIVEFSFGTDFNSLRDGGVDIIEFWSLKR